MDDDFYWGIQNIVKDDDVNLRFSFLKVCRRCIENDRK